MKKIIYTIFIFMIGFFFITSVDAATTTLKITCPTTVDINETFECSVFATVSGGTAKEIPLTISASGQVSKVKENINNENISAGTNRKLGTVTFKARSSSGNATINIKPSGRVIYTNGSSSSGGSTKHQYIKVRSNINTLSSIKIDNSTIPGFNKNTTSYTVSTTKSSISLTATKTSSKSTVTGTGTKNLKCGSNVYSLKVTAENGDTKNYTVGIRRTCNTNVYLEGINVSEGTLTPAFSRTVTDYTVNVAKDVDEITVTGVKASNSQTVTGNVTNKKLNYGSNKINIIVTSQTGAKQTYTINVIRENNQNSNIYLSSLSLSSGNIEFDKNTFEYETTVLYEVENIEVLATPEEETSKVTVEGNENLKVGDNYINVKVTSESGESKSYIIKVNRLQEGETLGDNPNIKNITIEGYDLEFDPEKIDYKLVIKKETSLNIDVTMEDENATYEIEGNENLEDGSIITIKTTSPDGSTNEYTIEITKTDYALYFIIAGAILLLAIAIPVIVYFKSVRKKKEEVDVNGYKIGEGYDDSNYSRQIISNNNAQTNNEQPQKEHKKFSLGNIIKPSHSKVPEDVKMSSPQTNSNQQLDKNGFDTDLQAYNPNNNINNIPNQNVNDNVNNINNIQNQTMNVNPDQNMNFDNNINNNPNQTMNIDQNPNINNQEIIEPGLTCPNCGRELLGNPESCPYCQTKLK